MSKYIRISDNENVISVVIDDCICVLNKNEFFSEELFFKYRSEVLDISCQTKEQLQKINKDIYGE